jgi:hypothetical protein
MYCSPNLGSDIARTPGSMLDIAADWQSTPRHAGRRETRAEKHALVSKELIDGSGWQPAALLMEAIQ